MSIRIIGRDALSGRFISAKEAGRRPETAVVETIQLPYASRRRRRRAVRHVTTNGNRAQAKAGRTR